MPNSASPAQGSDFRAVDDVLARQARDVRTRAADQFALDDCDSAPFLRQRPSNVFARFATAEHEIVIVINVGH